MKKKFEVGDEVAIDAAGRPGASKFIVTRVLKTHVVLDIGSKWTHDGRSYPTNRRGYSIFRLVRWSLEHRRARLHIETRRKCVSLASIVESMDELDTEMVLEKIDEIVDTIDRYKNLDR